MMKLRVGFHRSFSFLSFPFLSKVQQINRLDGDEENSVFFTFLPSHVREMKLAPDLAVVCQREIPFLNLETNEEKTDQPMIIRMG